MDFPKTIYVEECDNPFRGEVGATTLIARQKPEDITEEIVAIYTLKEVKKKVTNVTLEEI